MVFYYMYDCNHNSKATPRQGEPRMIDFEHVYKTYETHNDENVALEDINIHIDEGEFVFILGHSGAGKSTFLKLIQMEEKPTEGKVFYQWAGFNAHQAPQGCPTCAARWALCSRTSA